jgi:transcriptional regulator with XRE-family HTH domain
MINQEEIGRRIATLRKHRGYSQEELAKMLKMPRPSLAQIELGKRNITAGELLQLSERLEVSMDGLLAKNFDMTKEDLPSEKSKKAEKTQERISVPTLQVDKFKQVLLYVLERCAGKPNVGETVLNKLLYFIEFNYYERYEEHFIGATFKKLQFGPVPVNMDKILNQMEADGQVKMFKTDYYGLLQKRFFPLDKPDLKNLNAREIEVVDQVLNQFIDFSARAISEYSHKDMPWKATNEGEVINYELAFYREPPFSARVYENNEPE